MDEPGMSVRQVLDGIRRVNEITPAVQERYRRMYGARSRVRESSVNPVRATRRRLRLLRYRLARPFASRIVGRGRIEAGGGARSA